MKASWRTTTAGIAALVAAVASAAAAWFDNDPATVPDLAAISAAIAGVGLLFARDDRVSSERAGAT